MYETITADKAVSNGKKYITLPVVVILNAGIFLSLYLVATNQISIKWFIISFILSMTVIPWIYWSLTIMIWKNWAFENVRNVHELKRKAIEANLIYDDDSIFNITMIKFPSQKREWESLLAKFNQRDIIQKERFIDDLTIENETIIYFSKWKNSLYSLGGFAFLAVGISLFILNKDYVWGTIISLLGIFTGYNSLIQGLDTKPQIIINNKGIQTAATKFYNWSQIKNERISVEKTNNNIYYYLKYDHPRGSEEVNLNDLKVT